MIRMRVVVLIATVLVLPGCGSTIASAGVATSSGDLSQFGNGVGAELISMSSGHPFQMGYGIGMRSHADAESIVLESFLEPRYYFGPRYPQLQPFASGRLGAAFGTYVIDAPGDFEDGFEDSFTGGFLGIGGGVTYYFTRGMGLDAHLGLQRSIYVPDGADGMGGNQFTLAVGVRFGR